MKLFFLPEIEAVWLNCFRLSKWKKIMSLVPLQIFQKRLFCPLLRVFPFYAGFAQNKSMMVLLSIKVNSAMIRLVFPTILVLLPLRYLLRCLDSANSCGLYFQDWLFFCCGSTKIVFLEMIHALFFCYFNSDTVHRDSGDSFKRR